MTSTVPMWQHIVVVLVMLATQFAMYRFYLQRIDGLKAALHAKNVLLMGDDDGSWDYVAPDGTMVLTVDRYVKRIRVTSRNTAMLKVVCE